MLSSTVVYFVLPLMLVTILYSRLNFSLPFKANKILNPFRIGYTLHKNKIRRSEDGSNVHYK